MSNVYINRILESERFDTVIVETAGMAILSTLFYCASLARQRTIMVGDPATATHCTVQAGLRASRDADHRRSCPLPGITQGLLHEKVGAIVVPLVLYAGAGVDLDLS